jgi:hypothetical protein
MLTLSALWVAWRHQYSAGGLALALAVRRTGVFQFRQCQWLGDADSQPRTHWHWQAQALTR